MIFGTSFTHKRISRYTKSWIVKYTGLFPWILSHMLHVGNIYQHLRYIYAIHVGKYSIQTEHLGIGTEPLAGYWGSLFPDVWNKFPHTLNPFFIAHLLMFLWNSPQKVPLQLTFLNLGTFSSKDPYIPYIPYIHTLNNRVLSIALSGWVIHTTCSPKQILSFEMG